MIELNLIASELSMIIFENDNLGTFELIEKLRDYISENYSVMPCQIDYIIDKAYEIYEKI